MPHDGKGRSIEVGDRVVMYLRVVMTHDQPTGPNVTLSCLDMEDSGEGHLPVVECNSRLVERVEKHPNDWMS